MKKILLLFFLLFGVTITYSQTKKNTKTANTIKTTKATTVTSQVTTKSQIETEEWIKEKIENFTHDYNELNGTEYGIEKYEVEFSDCKIIIREKREGMSENVFNGKWDKSFFYDTYEIPIQKLSRINFTKDDKVTRIFFKIKSNESVITQAIESSLPSSKKDTVSVAILYIPNNLLADNLPERLTKAFDNLIPLCGGKITKEVF